MAFSFGQSGFATANTGGGGAAVETGEELREATSMRIGFRGLNKETKLVLLPNAWPADAPPPPSSSLLSISQKHGLIAAGGPESVVIAKTDGVRKAFYSANAETDYTPFKPDLTLPLGTRISQVAFSSDGSCLAISAEQGGGLAVYEVGQLLQGNTTSAFEMATRGTSLRALVANPAPELAELFAAITINGELLVADMKTRDFKAGPNGTVYKTGVSCISWSIKGKALLAGLADGTISQFMNDGQLMIDIPRPADLPPKHHVAAIDWLSIDLAIIAYSPDETDPTYPDPTLTYLMQRSGPKSGPKSHRFSRFPDVGIVNQPRLPNSPIMSGLTQYHNIDHLIVLSQSGSEDISMLIKCKDSLGDDAPPDAFSLISPLEDGRKASLPLTKDQSNSTTPIGMVIDLTSTDLVSRPVPGSEDVCEDSPGPLPGLMVLNNEGVLSAWWLIYSDAILAGTTYSGMVSANQGASQSASVPTANTSSFSAPKPQFGQTSAPQFGSTGFASVAAPSSGATPAFGQPAPLGGNKPAFGQSGFSSVPMSGAPGAGAASFGSASKLGQSASPFSQLAGNATKAPAFGASAFGGGATGTPNPPAFGSASTLGAKAASPWGGASTTSGKPFGSPSTFGQASAEKPNPFMKAGESPSGFAAAASKPAGNPFGTASPFGKVNQTTTDKANPFSKPTEGSSSFAALANKSKGSAFGSGGSFGQTGQLGQTKSVWGQTDDKPKVNPFTSDAKLGFQSSFSQQTTKPTENTAPSADSTKSLFGSGFGDALSTASKQAPSNNIQDHEEDMEDDTPTQKVPESPEITQSTTPQETPAAQKTTGAPPSNADAFGSKTTSLDAPAATPNTLAAPSFGFPRSPEATPKPQPSQASSAEDRGKAQAGIPLPPDTRSKDTYTPTNSSTSSSIDSLLSAGAPESAPLPPDPVKFKPKVSADDFPPLPPDFTKTASKAPTNAPPTDPVKPPSRSASKPPPFNPFSAPAAKAKESKPEQATPLPADDASPLDDEGSGIDVANELSTDVSPESSFLSKSSSASIFTGKGSGSFKQPAPGGVRSVFADVPKPHVDFFKQPEPSDVPDSPRSPSPTRPPKPAPFSRPPPPGVLSSGRSASGPAVHKGASGQRKPTLGRPQPPTQKVVSPIASALKEGAEKERQAAEAKAKAKREEEEQELSDHEDEYIRAELEAPVEPTTKLPGFIAHQDYIGEVSKEGIPGQIEIVYRDANSMVDTLGLNLRGIKSWVAGHSNPGAHRRGRLDMSSLDSADDWNLADLDHTEEMREEIEDELVDSSVDDIGAKLQVFKESTLELHKLKKRNDDISKTLEILKRRAEGDEGDDLAPLGVAQSEAQQDLRRAFADFRSSLAAAEEGVALLRAKLVSHRKGADTGMAQKAPTVEAIERTINKMTGMIEKKSADLDVLTSRLQKLGYADRPSSSRGLLQGRRSRSGSPFESPVPSRPTSSAKNASPMRASVSGKAAFTPRGSRLGNSHLAEDMSRLVLRSSIGAAPLTNDDLERYTKGLKQRKEVNAVLKQALGSGEVRVRTLDD